MNSINLVGNICKDLQLKTTSNGKNVCSFDIAVRRPFTKDVTDFFTIVCWNKAAENVCRYCGKGTRIGVSGTMTTRKNQDKEGNNRTVYEVMANDIIFVEKKGDGQGSTASTNYAPEINGVPEGFMPIDDEDLPF